ncbi:MAG: family 43 glycosylhydrolase [Ruminococcus sp.]|nr:family 43 glycosylhydrolase [Ruminococcus sp.]
MDIKTKARGRNPILPLNYHIPDCEARVMPDGRLYLFGSCDTDSSFYCSEEYQVFSTDDMIHWQAHGRSFCLSEIPQKEQQTVSEVSWLSSVDSFEDLPLQMRSQIPNIVSKMPFKLVRKLIASGMKGGSQLVLYAPDAIEKDGKYYLYYCLSNGSEGVAIAEKPSGPYQFCTQFPIAGIDPSVFIDDDGQAYLYWGQFVSSAARLLPDMVTIEENSVVHGLVTEKEHFFHEGSSVRKRGDIYYYVFADSSSGKPTALGYAMGTSPLGPFRYQGVIIDNIGCDPESWNNHGSIEEYHGQWYVFYHRSSRGSNSMRRVCAEPITFREDGTIVPVEMTSMGAGSAFTVNEFIPAYTACRLSGKVRLMPDEESGQCELADGFADGDGLYFKYIDVEEQRQGSVFLEDKGSADVCVYLDDILIYGREVTAPVTVPPGRYTIRIQINMPEKYQLYGLKVSA